MKYFDTWQFLAGLGIFLLGLYFIEQALKRLAGRPFKRFLRKQTTHPLKGIAGGALITAILQSSSVVSLMVLAFVGAGILSLRNAIGVIFGSNLGSTITGWIVASLGFEWRIDDFALPFLAIGALLMVFFPRMERLHETGRFLLGLGFLFMGLQFMKSSVEYLAANLDISVFNGLHPYVFFPIGIVLAAIFHSSAAVVAVTLSGLHAGIVPLDSAITLVIGSDLGTTMTVVVGALKGSSAKKQVAASHVIFNLITAGMALVFMHPILWIIQEALAISNELYTLVTFHSGFNLLGVILLSPFIGVFARKLEKWFSEESNAAVHIGRVPASIPEAAIEALRKEILDLMEQVLALNLLGIHKGVAFAGIRERGNPALFAANHYPDHYARLKEREGEIVAYCLNVQNEELESEESVRLSQYTRSVRNAVQSAKGIKDIEHNIREFEKSSNDAKIALLVLIQGQLVTFYSSIHRFLKAEEKAILFESMHDLALENQEIQERFTREIYATIKAGNLGEIEISTFLNVSREIYNSNRAFILAMADVFLSKQETEDFYKIPETK